MVLLRILRALPARLIRRSQFSETQRRCDQLIADLQVSAPFHMETLIERVSDSLGRPIIPIPVNIPHDGPTGILVQTAAVDYILFRRNTSRVHQESIVLHELAHILCGHIELQGMDETRSRVLFPDLDPDMVVSMLGRAGYSDFQEREAELFASVLRTKLDNWMQIPEWIVQDDIAPIILRIERALGSRKG